MRQTAFRNSLLAFLGSVIAAFLLASCGGGGGGTASNAQGGLLQVGAGGTPSTAYAGVPFTLTIVGGRAPYNIIVNDPAVLPLPASTTTNSVTVVPPNPGVVDAGLAAGALQIRSVTVTVRDGSGQTATTIVQVAQNFLTGYGIVLTPTTCPAGSSGTTTVASACAGGETAIRFAAITNGTLVGDKTFTVSVVRGDFFLRNPATGQSGSSVTATSDHTGQVLVLAEVTNNAQTQIAIIRIQDTATGVYTDEAFVITGVPGATTGSGAITAIPNALTFTAALSTDCGTGSADVLVFDGTPPYNAVSTDPNVTVTPTVSSTNPGKFTINAFNSSICLGPATVVITDSVGRRTTVTVTTKPGSITPTPPAAFSVSPTDVTVGCGQTATVSVVGGSGLYFANSAHPRIIAFAFGNSVGITRATGDGGGVFATTGTVTIGDGSNVAPVTVHVPATCP